MSNPVTHEKTDRVPEPVVRVAELMSTFGSTWALCGGWAVDAWLGRLSREHEDTDIVIFLDDLGTFFGHLSGWLMIAHDAEVGGDTAEPWNGRPLVLPAHIHARPEASEPPDTLHAPAQQGFGLDVQVSERSGDEWIMSREPLLSIPLSRAIQVSAWGVPAVTPEALLFYKAGEMRRQDQLDFVALLPHLTHEQRDWLRDALSLAGHPWLSHLS